MRLERLDGLGARRPPSCAEVFTIGGRHAGSAGEVEHHRQLRHRAVGALALGLVDDEDVGDLEDPGLDRLDVVAEARHEHDGRRVRGAHDVDLVLADADRLDEDHVEARGVEHVDGVARRAGEARRARRASPSSG